MAPLKGVKSLFEISQKVAIDIVKVALEKLHKDDDDGVYDSEKISQLKEHLNGQPVQIQDKLAEDLLKFAPNRCVVYQFLTNERGQRLHVRETKTKWCWRAWKCINPEEVLVKDWLTISVNLLHLTLDGATNELLELVGTNCRKLEVFNVNFKSQEIDGLHWIIPTSEDEENEICLDKGCNVKTHGCPELVTLKIGYCGDNDNMKFDILKYFKKLKSFKCEYISQFSNISTDATKVEYLQMTDITHKVGGYTVNSIWGG